MKHLSLSFVAVVLFATSTFARTIPAIKQNAGISFIENKGQVHDQNYQARPDVLFSARAGNMVVHIKNNGLSYQLYRVDKYKEAETQQVPFLMNQPGLQEIEQETIQRIDLNWLNYNKNFTVTQDEVLPGYTNYYTVNCPNGALHVMSYKGVTLKNLYAGINLHYYEKNGDLKHDYIVAAHADYKQIQLKVSGADISLNEDGSLLLSTPLGKIEEGAPMVYQNGKQLKAKWIIKSASNSHSLNFEIENYDPDQELIIDPVTRAWGTYYGGAGDDYFAGMSTDPTGNVYLAGNTTTSVNIVIATGGAQQSVYAGGIEAVLAKFSPGGVRLWATYYGGIVDEKGLACHFDASGFVYFSGSTTSGQYLTSSSGVIASWGAHETQSWGKMDAFLVKFNTSGVRQWGTFYSGSENEEGTAVTTDPLGNVYLAGNTSSNNQIVTAVGHQTLYGGGSSFDRDAFLVKFNSAGQRLWGTYYGDFGDDRSFSCVTDATGNVYMAGYTAGANNTIITTPGSHQNVFGGGSSDAFIVKFNTNGVRQWGTYYGGTGSEGFSSCVIDANNNLYLSGGSSSPSTTRIATPGSHQALAGGLGDAFLTRFNTNGQRQWATYYGGAQYDTGLDCALDPNGNVFLSGLSSSSSGTDIATPGSYQATYGGGSNGNAYLAKFDATGQRLWATYYGAAVYSAGSSCATDLFSNVFMAGFTNTGAGSVFSTPPCHQATIGGGIYDAYLVKFDDCTLAPAQPSVIAGPTVTCFGIAATYSTPFVPGANSYSLFAPGGNTGFSYSNSFSISPATSGVYTLVASNGCGVSPQQTVNVTVNSTPTLSLNSGTICAGQSFMLVPGGATTYTYGAGPLVSPAFTSTYVVAGTNSVGCTSFANSTVYVNPAPTVVVSSGVICPGQSFTIFASGASTYSFSAGPVVSPNITTSYIITGTNSFGCSRTAVSTVTVEPYPTISVNSGAICVGKSFVLSPSGAYSYTYSGGTIVSPIVTTSYSVIGKSQAGCAATNTAISTVTVNPLPDISPSTSSSLLCAGEEATLSANGASTYVFNPGGAGASIVVAPIISTTYTITGTDSNGCSNTALLVVNVAECTSIKNVEPIASGSGIKISIFPNPTSGIINLEMASDNTVVIMNAIGQIVYSSQHHSGTHQLSLQSLARGIYIVKVGNAAQSQNIKLIKE